MADTAPSAPPRLVEFFLAEASGYVTTLREALWVNAAERDTARFLSAARGLRGAAAMARLTDLAVLAGRIERIARAIHLRRAAWTDPLSYSLQAVGYELPDLVAAAPHWSSNDSARASAIVAALQPFAPPQESAQVDGVLPIARLFHADGGPHVIYAAVTPQTQFEQQLREPAPVSGAPATEGRVSSTTPPQPAVRRGQTGERPKSPRPAIFQQPEARPERARPPDRATILPGDGSQVTPARGNELRGLLAKSLESFAGLESSMNPGQAMAGEGDGPVPIESLLYRGRAALERAKEIRAAHASAGTEPSGSDLDELMELVALATEV